MTSVLIDDVFVREEATARSLQLLLLVRLELKPELIAMFSKLEHRAASPTALVFSEALSNNRAKRKLEHSDDDQSAKSGSRTASLVSRACDVMLGDQCHQLVAIKKKQTR